MRQNRQTNAGASQADAVETRLGSLEERLAFAEHALDNLSGVLTAAQAQLDRLERESRKLKAHVERISELGLGEDLPQEKPPHY